MLGVAVHSRHLILVNKNEERKVSYDSSGIQEILNAAKQDDGIVILAGNRKWAKALAYSLQGQGLKVRYLGLPGKPRGKKMSAAAFLKIALEKGLKGYSFFRTGIEEHPHPWVEKAKEYFILEDDIRRVKSRIREELRLLCPEAMQNPQKLWTKKALEALKEALSTNSWQRLIEIISEKHIPSGQLLSNWVPEEEKEKAKREILSMLEELKEKKAKEAQIKLEIEELAQGHPIVEMFGGTFSSSLVACLIGWRKWKWRHLRNYCGLSVKRLDSKGNLRIDRKHPETRTAIYQLLKSKKAKQIVAAGLKRRGRTRAPRPKIIEILLKAIWKECLKAP